MGCVCSRASILINNNKYYIREHIADGGFSTVFLVQDVNSHKVYALKKLICHSKEDYKRAMQEIHHHEVVKHLNVIECMDSSVHGGPPDPVTNSKCEVLILLPYFKRGTLANELYLRSKNNDHLSAIEILPIFLQICEGLKAFHEVSPEPLAHRDLKTANILLGDNGEAVIMDLGSVCPARMKICGSSEAQNLQDFASETCSMPYRAPELFHVESYCMIDERTDIWSLGCVLYAMCFFKSPYDTVYERGDSVALAVISGNIEFPNSSPFDQDIHDLILYMLKVNPMERPYIYSIIEKTHDLISKSQTIV